MGVWSRNKWASRSGAGLSANARGLGDHDGLERVPRSLGNYRQGGGDRSEAGVGSGIPLNLVNVL